MEQDTTKFTKEFNDTLESIKLDKREQTQKLVLYLVLMFVFIFYATLMMISGFSDKNYVVGVVMCILLICDFFLVLDYVSIFICSRKAKNWKIEQSKKLYSGRYDKELEEIRKLGMKIRDIESQVALKIVRETQEDE